MIFKFKGRWMYIFVLVAVTCLGAVLVFLCVNKKQVNIIYQGTQQIENNDILEPCWFLVTEKGNADISKLGLSLDMIDFSRNNVIVAIGSEINRIELRKKSGMPFLNSHFITVYFEGEFMRDAAYIYLIDKIEVYQDLRDPNSVVTE